MFFAMIFCSSERWRLMDMLVAPEATLFEAAGLSILATAKRDTTALFTRKNYSFTIQNRELLGRPG